jgi:predicted Zn finger-like uncharacterized protein
MILTCPACQTRYQVDAAKFPPQGRNVRCARCSNVWHATPDTLNGPETEPDWMAPEPASAPAFAPAEPVREAYAQPDQRDPEPQENEGVYDEPAAPVAAKSGPPGWLIGAGWAALVGVVLLIGVIATVYRQQVVEAWPQSASLYSKLGMKVASSGLKIGHTKFSRDIRKGQHVLTVAGALTNVADRELAVPQLCIGLVDSEKRELYHWTVAPDVMMLRPGQSTRFVTELSNPPDEAVNYEVRFAKAGE